MKKLILVVLLCAMIRLSKIAAIAGRPKGDDQ